jgi:hypothetical protein
MSMWASVTDAFSWLSAEDDRTDPKQSPTASTDDDVGDGNLRGDSSDPSDVSGIRADPAAAG